MTDDLEDDPEDPVLRIAQSTNTSGPSQMVIYQSTYDAKIKQHEELEAAGHGVEEIADTFSQPAAVYDGRVPGKHFVHVSGTHAYMGHPLTVVASQIEGTTSSRMATAYYTSAFNTRTPRWKKDDSNG